ncbi:hypothetical protein [Pseudarthrobacter siccitolerans]
MGTVLAAASALAVATAGAAAALSAPFGAAGHGGQYLAGHVLLGLGLGHSIAILLRTAVKRLFGRRAVRSAPKAPGLMAPEELPARPAAMVPAAAAAQATMAQATTPRATRAPATRAPANAAQASTASVTVLPAPSAALVSLRGRHAA